MIVEPAHSFAKALRVAAACLLAGSGIAGCNASSAVRALPGSVPVPGTFAAPNALALPAGKHGGPAIVLSPLKLALYGIGKSGAKKVVASETAFTGSFTLTSTCAKVAGVTPSTGHGPSLTVTVTPIAYGSCSIVFADGKGNKSTLPVTDQAGGTLSFPLLVPTHAPRDKHRGRKLSPKWMSPSAQAMTVAITGPTNLNVVSGLTVLSPGCQLTLQGLNCTFATSLAACPTPTNCYTATIETYDAYDPSTNTIPADAAPLAISKSTFTIAANQVNNVTFNFSGIPAQIVVLPGSALSNSTGNIIDLIGPGAHKMFAEALDADNNLIAGLGGPSYSISSSGNLQVTLTQPPPGSPRFTVAPPSTLQGPGTIATLTVTAKYPAGITDGCAQPGAVCSGAVTLDMQSLLAVSSGYSVELFAAEKGVGPISSLTSGIVNPLRDVKYDAHGNLFVATYTSASSQNVLEYALGSTIPFRTITSGISSPIKLALDPAGNLFVLNVSNATVTEYPPGATTPSKTISVSSFPTQLVVDAADDLWVASIAGTSVTYYPHGSSTGTPLTGLVRPVGIALDPATNTLYVSDNTHFSISQQAACGSDDTSNTFCTIYAYPFNSSSPATPTYSTSSYGGNLVWAPGFGLFADDSTGKKLAYYYGGSSPPVTPAAWTGGLNAGDGGGIAVDQLGNLFVAAPFQGLVNEYLYVAFFSGGINETVPPHLQITNGLTFPYNLAIIP